MKNNIALSLARCIVGIVTDNKNNRLQETITKTNQIIFM